MKNMTMGTENHVLSTVSQAAENRSVHGTDQSCDPGWKADHPSDPGDLPYLADSHAFYLRFGDRVSVLNSRMSAGERFDQYERARTGDIDIIIGPRSALLCPLNDWEC